MHAFGGIYADLDYMPVSATLTTVLYSTDESNTSSSISVTRYLPFAIHPMAFCLSPTLGKWTPAEALASSPFQTHGWPLLVRDTHSG
jgi:hypothetical protein